MFPSHHHEELYFASQHANPAAPVVSHPPQEAAFATEMHAAHSLNPRSSFPEKLHGLIMDAETMGFDDVVSWQDSGKSFKVHKPQIFQNDVIPKYFKPIKYTSFQRQLSIYGFQRIRTGWNTGGYEHPCFTRNDSSMCRNIRRHQKPTVFSGTSTATAGTVSAPAITTAQPAVVPNHVPSSVVPMAAAAATAAAINESHFMMNDHVSVPMTTIDDDLFKMYGDLDPFDLTIDPIKVPAAAAAAASVATSAPATKYEHHDFEPLPLGSTCLPRVSSHTDLLQHDDHFMLDKLQSCFQDEMHAYGGIIENPLKAAEAQTAAATTASNSNNNNSNSSNKGAFFPAKLHQLLEDAERLNFRHIVSWTDNGRAFQIHDQKEFVGKIMSIYFDQSKFASFRRQLNLYGFNRTRTNNNKNMYFHENFVQGDPKLCEQMFRRCSGGAAKPVNTCAPFAA